MWKPNFKHRIDISKEEKNVRSRRVATSQTPYEIQATTNDTVNNTVVRLYPTQEEACIIEISCMQDSPTPYITNETKGLKLEGGPIRGKKT